MKGSKPVTKETHTQIQWNFTFPCECVRDGMNHVLSIFKSDDIKTQKKL